MTTQKDWTVKGKWWECCLREGQCPMWFGRDLREEAGKCTSFQTYLIEEGQIQNVDMKGIKIIHLIFEVGPKMSDHLKGIDEGAVYISDNATPEQREILEPFVTTGLFCKNWKKVLGIKYVPIDISEANGTYHITMPFGEQKMTVLVGGDGKNPMTLENSIYTFCSLIRICNTYFWNYHDYGKNLEIHNASGALADFSLSGD